MQNTVSFGDNITAYNCNCIELMQQMVSDNVKVDLTVTSPPYDDLRTYKKSSIWSFETFKNIADLLYNITADGGIVVWVVGDATVNGGETGSSFKQALYFVECGFKLHDTMIFEKNSSTFPARRNGSRYTQIFEYMFVFSKGKPKISNLICDKVNKWAGHTNWGQATAYDKDGNLKTARNIKQVPDFSPRTNIWKYTTGFNINKGKHPAVFPFNLAEDHILTWSNEGDTVFDPFLGSGTTLFASIKNNRHFIGSELNKEYFDALSLNYEEYQKKWEKHI